MDASTQLVSQPRTKRHYRTAAERRQIVEETLAPRTSVAMVARAHGVNANQVFAWRKLYQAGLLRSTDAASVSEPSPRCRLLPVTVSADTEGQPSQAAPAVSSERETKRTPLVSPGWIELGLAKAQVRISGDVEASVLRTVLEWLRG